MQQVIWLMITNVSLLKNKGQAAGRNLRLIREGSSERNTERLMRGVIENGLPTENLMFCTDDKMSMILFRKVTSAINSEIHRYRAGSGRGNKDGND
jgi:hypothetical protein